MAQKKAKPIVEKAPTLGHDILSRNNPDGSVAIMRLDNSDYFFVLDGIAAEAWGQFNGKKSLEKIASDLAKKHRAPVDRLGKDLKKLMGQLRAEHLLS